MSRYLAAETPTDGDATFRNFQRHNVGVAAEHFGGDRDRGAEIRVAAAIGRCAGRRRALAAGGL